MPREEPVVRMRGEPTWRPIWYRRPPPGMYLEDMVLAMKFYIEDRIRDRAEELQNAP